MQGKKNTHRKLKKKAKSYADVPGSSHSNHSAVTVVTKSNRDSFYSDLGAGGSSGERVKVVVRIRPMNQKESNRSDEYVVQAQDDKFVVCVEDNKQFKFNVALDENNYQEHVFEK